jgi:two-component system phosphate regulon sensor histidine kinase PhoR
VRSRIFFKLMGAFLLVIAAVTATLDYTVRHAWEESLLHEIRRNLIDKTHLFAQRVQAERARPLMELARQEAAAADARATIIDSTGKVLADSDADPATMENHATRPEFVAALAGRVGSSIRFSHTLSIDFMYVAAPIPGGAVRLAYPLAAIQRITAQVRSTLLKSSALAILVAILLAALIAQSISSRLRRIVRFADQVAAGDLSARIAENASDEIAQVASALDKTARTLETTFAAVESSRSELETLLNSIQDAVVAVSPARKVQWANRSMQQLLPVRVGALMAETIRDPDLLGALQGPLEAHQVRRARATSVLPGRTFAVTAAPMPGGGAVAVLHDLTDVERTEKMRRDFIANVSHELRTPLTSIQGYAETLLETAPGGDGATREFLEIIRKNASRMTRLTEDLLVLARVESGEQKLELQAVPAGELVEDARATLSGMVRAQGMELQVGEQSACPVRADRDAIHQVFANLVDNATKYAAAGGKIVLEARAAEKGVEFAVRDFGPGIPSQHLPRLFERFYRVDTARSREAGGTGLGLAIVKHIVLQHGGSVRADSQLQHGSAFFFTLPAARDS